MMASSFGKNAVSGVAKDPSDKPEKAKNEPKADAQAEGKKGKNKKNAPNEATKKVPQEVTKAQEKQSTQAAGTMKVKEIPKSAASISEVFNPNAKPGLDTSASSKVSSSVQ